MLGPPGFENGCRHRFLSESHDNLYLHDNFYLNVWPSPRATARRVETTTSPHASCCGRAEFLPPPLSRHLTGDRLLI
jgi:hypothetical protein